MALPNVNIVLTNGALGRVAATNDGVAGLVLTGTEVSYEEQTGDGENKTKVVTLELDKVYQLSKSTDLNTLGVTEENNPLVYKEVNAFYAQAGEGAELYIIVMADTTTLTQMCANNDTSALKKLINYARGRIRLVGLNRLPASAYTPENETSGIDKDAIDAAAAIKVIAADYEAKVNPIRFLVPALCFTGKMEDKFFSPRESSNNRTGFVLSADKLIGKFASASVAQVLGRAAAISVHQSIARVKDGSIATDGYLTDGKTPEEHDAILPALNDAGYIFYRTFVGKNGYYLNDDPMAASVTDDYTNLNLGRVIDKAIILTYNTYIDEIMDSIEVGTDGKLPQSICSYFESLIENAVSLSMNGEISSFDAYVDPAQNVLSTSRLDVVCKIVPRGTLREINVSLGFSNPALKQ